MGNEARGHPSLGERTWLRVERETQVGFADAVLAGPSLLGTITSSCEQSWDSLAQGNIFQHFGNYKAHESSSPCLDGEMGRKLVLEKLRTNSFVLIASVNYVYLGLWASLNTWSSGLLCLFQRVIRFGRIRTRKDFITWKLTLPLLERTIHAT